MTRLPDSDDRREDLVRSILDRTSGPACSRCLEMLPRLARDDLAGLDRTLVQAHLEHCDQCRAVAVVLGWLQGELPAMATIDPGEEFTTAVLTRTARLPSRAAAAGRLTGGAGLMDRLGNWWERQLRRPLFVWQVAYVLTVILVMLTTLPGAPLHGVPEQVRTSVQTAYVGVPLTEQVMQAADRRVKNLAGLMIDSTWGRLHRELVLRRANTIRVRGGLDDHMSRLWSDFHQGRSGQAVLQFVAIGRDLKRLWRAWWHPDLPFPEQVPERRPS